MVVVYHVNKLKKNKYFLSINFKSSIFFSILILLNKLYTSAVLLIYFFTKFYNL